MFCLVYLLLVVSTAAQTIEWGVPFVPEQVQTRYEPTWESLDTRPIPSWYDKAKIGIFLHWGVFSVPSFGSEWFWASWKSNSTNYVNFMRNNYPPHFTYQHFAKDFTCEFFDADKWASLFSLSGAKYVVLTSKHHEGYTLWPSKFAYSWNSVDVGPHRDLIKELSDAIRKNTDLHFGLYHSLYEWFHPLYISDKKNNFTSRIFSLGKSIPELKELVNNYQPHIIWSDGDWEAPDDYWGSRDFLAWLYNDSPVKDVVVANDRWGQGIPCKHGDFYTCQDRYNPGVLQNHKWENAMTIDKKSWGYRRNADLQDYMSITKLLRTLAETVSCGGNLNMNIGPTKEGTILPIFQERLLQMGVWLGYNGEAIYDSVPWKHQNDSIADCWYTASSKDRIVYAIFLTWPETNVLTLGDVTPLFNGHVTVNLLGWEVPEDLKYHVFGDKVDISLPDLCKVSVQWAWVIKIKY